MNNFQIETAQNVNIVQNVAGIGERILAYLIDSLIIVAYVFIIIIIMSIGDIGDDLSFIIAMTVGLPIFLYHLLWEMFWNGRSPGKAVMKLRVVKLDGSRPAFSGYLLRWLLRIIDISLTSGALALVTVLLNGKGQRIGDLAAKTTVISEKIKISFNQTILVDIPLDYKPKYPQVTVFTDLEIQTIKNLFIQAKVNGNHNVVLKLSEKVAKVMEITFEETPILFIDKVIKDYNFYTQNI
ncbi:MAG: RDD family protein [Flavobacteriaceae bacterium]|nr:RDD family protein [Flavobacteriaceae bacterium]